MRREPGHDEQVYPSARLDEQFERELEELRKLAGPSGTAPAGGLVRIKQALEGLQNKYKR